MTEQNWKAYEFAASTIIGTGMNALADGANSLGPEIDNSALGNVFDDLIISLIEASGTRTADAHVKVTVLRAIDGSAYPEGDDSVDPSPSNDTYTALFGTDASIVVQTISGIVLPNSKFKYLVQNETGLKFGATGNTIERRAYNLKTT